MSPTGTDETVATTRLGKRVALVAAAIGIVYGYDSGSISSALVYLKSDYHLSTLWVSVVTSIIVVGSLVGAVCGPRLANDFGRKPCMVLVAAGFTVFAGLSAAPLGVWWLTIVRLFLGVTIGLSTVVAPIFISEFAAEHQRGKLATSYQFFTSAGVVISLVVGFALAETGSWETMLGIAAIPAALVLVLIVKFPDSPRWYGMRGRWEDAEATLRRMDPAVAETRLAEIRADLATAETGRFREIFTRHYAKATVFVIGFGFFVQITGNNTILYYSPIIFQRAGIANDQNSILVSAIVQVFSIIGVVASMLTVDRWGRRPLLLTGSLGMVAGFIVMTIVFALGAISTTTGYVAVAAIALFYVGFYFGIGSLIWVYCGEAFPARLRSVGASVLLITDFAANLVATFAFPSMLDALGATITFAIFVVMSAAAFVFMYMTAPETRGRSLEEIRNYWDKRVY